MSVDVAKETWYGVGVKRTGKIFFIFTPSEGAQETASFFVPPGVDSDCNTKAVSLDRFHAVFKAHGKAVDGNECKTITD